MLVIQYKQGARPDAVAVLVYDNESGQRFAHAAVAPRTDGDVPGFAWSVQYDLVATGCSWETAPLEGRPQRADNINGPYPSMDVAIFALHRELLQALQPVKPYRIDVK